MTALCFSLAPPEIQSVFCILLARTQLFQNCWLSLSENIKISSLLSESCWFPLGPEATCRFHHSSGRNQANKKAWDLQPHRPIMSLLDTQPQNLQPNDQPKLTDVLK
ncbi:uncharacterized protein LOC129758263 [Uranotaenia lowii]|uniref:uncharacterized protein LOC129758263 n=1 Tax=Uranotaenia lowii TaxID=190385 RepID=UPI00247AEA36|nr:uncharacterized protein LOC129758263 [Uranotaenia lowii]